MYQLNSEYQAVLTELGGSVELLDSPPAADENDDGRLDLYRFAPPLEPSTHNAPPVIFYTDAGGIRPSMFRMARQLADAGYEVLMPNFYHRSGTYAPFDASTLFDHPAEMARLQSLGSSVTKAQVMADTGRSLEWLATTRGPNVPIRCVGYCMGGGLALTAAGTFAQVTAAASFHGGHLATAAPDSPHRLADKMTGRIYIGAADQDPYFPAEECRRLEAALKEAGIDFHLEIYPGAPHGFAVPDMPVFDAAASARHWQTLLDFFAG